MKWRRRAAAAGVIPEREKFKCVHSRRLTTRIKRNKLATIKLITP